MRILFNSILLILDALIVNTITSGRLIYAQNSADYYVKSLPGLTDNSNLLKSHAGHINIDKDTNTNIFFWLLHNKHIADKSRLIIWLNGGPGCSSLDGLFLENGPWRIKDDQTLNLTSSSWNEYTNVLYVDQPAGTGFSFADSNSYLTNVTQIPTQFLLFLDKFFGMFPEFSRDEVYLTGESFAGTFIPYIAKAILDRNHARKTSEHLKYNLKGIAIGNGWIDPANQYNAYYTFAVEKNLLDGQYKSVATNQLKMCTDELNKQVKVHVKACEEILSTVLQSSRRSSGGNDNCVNLYDIRDYTDTFPACGRNWPYELKTIKAYLRRADVIGAIHADSQTIGWTECNSGVGHLFNDDTTPPSITLFPELLKNINILLYNGDQDLVCNVNGMKDLISNLEWNGFKGFKNATGNPWYINDQTVGEVTSERNLTYAVIYQASHMAPYDAPLQSLDIMYRFIGLNRNLTKQGFTSKIGNEDLITGDNTETTSAPKDWDKYYNAGTATLVIVILGVVGLAIWVCRGKLLRRKRTTTSQAMKAAVESVDNEMEELVIETPLFQSDDVDHFGDSDEENDEQKLPSEQQNVIRERNQSTRYRDDDSGNNSEERIRLRNSEDH